MLLKNPVSHSNRDAAAREEKCIRQMGRTLLELASSVEFVLGFAPRPRKTRATHELRTSYARATRELHDVFFFAELHSTASEDQCHEFLAVLLIKNISNKFL